MPNRAQFEHGCSWHDLPRVRKLELDELIKIFQHRAESHAQVHNRVSRHNLPPTSRDKFTNHLDYLLISYVSYVSRQVHLPAWTRFSHDYFIISYWCVNIFPFRSREGCIS